MATSKRFWLSFDLGIDGDYDGLYCWLDELKAVECGDGLCSFEMDVNDKEPSRSVLGVIRKEMKLRKKDRLYLIWRRPDGSVTGKFITGGRRRAPWSGYAVEASEESENAR